MTDSFIDTDVLIRFLTGDDPAKQESSAKLFQAIEDGLPIVRAPVTVIADAVHVLSTLRRYAVPRADLTAMLSTLVRHAGFQVDQRSVVLTALSLFAQTNVDFGDCLLVSSMRHAGAARLYSYDRDFDRITGIERVEPGSSA